ncbi:hypothetical protein WR25_03614 [Diploscapter pachys]|uniref:Importin subunit beta-1/Transportin-1-like TPR repeats domain-containing protein n=1 Tax=Diploscapter pachys TaxID=2018661 RepID=A0A2A2L5G6_9BILA|nr:hypothetical protein WR25_03614 [Diploscapter pachys]
MAFGSILDGPDPSKLTPLVQQAIPALINSMSDPNVNVRDTTAWTIGRVLEICPAIVNNAELRDSLLGAMSQGLGQEPRVATNVCWAIVALVKAAYEAAREEGTDVSGQPETYALSHVYQGMITELVRVTDRPDGHQANLRLAAFETLMELIKDSPKDCYQHVQSTTMMMLTKLEQLLNMEIASTNSTDKNQLVDLQALLCATLQSVLRRLRTEDAPVVGEPIMKGLLQIMSRATGKGGNVMEEALLAVSTLVETLGVHFEQYMPLLKPHLMAGLANHEEAQVCAAAVGVVADLCRALEVKMVPHLNEIMELLVVCLQHPKVPKDVKVTILSCFGDIALSIGPHFEQYLPVVMNMLAAASTAAVVTNIEDQDQLDYVDSLRDACVNAYTGILQAARPADNEDPQRAQAAKQAFVGYVNPMIEMILKCCDLTPVPPSDTLMASVCGLIGDLVCMYGADILPALNNDKVSNLINKARRSRISKTKATANWAFKELRKVMPKANEVNFDFKSG